MSQDKDYSLFMEFMRRYEDSGYQEIDRSDPFIQEVEAYTEKKDQFFVIGDFIKIHVLWTSARCQQIMGVPPEQFNPYIPFEATHQDDIQKHASGRVKLFETVNNLFTAKKGKVTLSGDLRIRNGEGVYNNLLFQLFMFYSSQNNTVFLFEVHTVINSFSDYKRGSHYYCGTDYSNFRYPDKELLNIGNPFSNREIEIIKLIEQGMNSKDIADKLCLSYFTVNTHRTNILRKSGCRSFSELIHRFNEKSLR